MKTFRISWMERHVYWTDVEAESEEDAIEMVRSGEFLQALEGEYIEIEDGSIKVE